jgi:hypothetical protein
MPGRGRSEERPYTAAERETIESGAENRGRSADDALALLGGYQVIKKWLSYREQPLVGRALKPEEVREVTTIARRIPGILLTERELDAGYWKLKEGRVTA